MDGLRLNDTLRENAALHLLTPATGDYAEGGFVKGDKVMVSNPADRFDGRKGKVTKVWSSRTVYVDFAASRTKKKDEYYFCIAALRHA